MRKDEFVRGLEARLGRPLTKEEWRKVEPPEDPFSWDSVSGIIAAALIGSNGLCRIDVTGGRHAVLGE